MNDFEPIVVLVCGGRDYTDRDMVFDMLETVHEGRGPIVELIHGAATGADTLAAEWADTNNIPQKQYPANWEDLSHPDAVIRRSRDGRFFDARAGVRRNQLMLTDAKPNLVVAFPGGPGTAHMRDLARSNGVKVMRILQAVEVAREYAEYKKRERSR